MGPGLNHWGFHTDCTINWWYTSISDLMPYGLFPELTITMQNFYQKNKKCSCISMNSRNTWLAAGSWIPSSLMTKTQYGCSGDARSHGVSSLAIDLVIQVASSMSLMASLVTTSRMQQCFNVFIDIYHEFLLLFYCCVLFEIKPTTTTMPEYSGFSITKVNP